MISCLAIGFNTIDRLLIRDHIQDSRWRPRESICFTR